MFRRKKDAEELSCGFEVLLKFLISKLFNPANGTHVYTQRNFLIIKKVNNFLCYYVKIF